MKILNILLPILFIGFISCNKNVAVEKDWTDSKVKMELKQELMNDPLFVRHMDAIKKIQVKSMLGTAIRYDKYDSTVVSNLLKDGKTMTEAANKSGGMIDLEFAQLTDESRATFFQLVKKYQGLRFFTKEDWQQITSEELNKNFENNIRPFLGAAQPRAN